MEWISTSIIPSIRLMLD